MKLIFNTKQKAIMFFRLKYFLLFFVCMFPCFLFAGSGKFQVSTITANGNVYIDKNVEVDGELTKARAYINSESGTTYTVTSEDSNGVVYMTNSSSNTVTLPATAAVGFTVTIIQGGTGSTLVEASGGDTVNSFNGLTRLAGQYAASTAVCITEDSTWFLSGNLISE